MERVPWATLATVGIFVILLVVAIRAEFRHL